MTIDEQHEVDLRAMNQSTGRVLMIEPVNFAPNEETIPDNAFQHAGGKNLASKYQAQALEEFQSFEGKLRAAGVEVVKYQDLAENNTPDSIFPNNWFSTHEGSALCIYPMMAPSRRRERRRDIIDDLRGFYSTVVDFTSFEEQGAFLESTGSLVLDRVNRIAFASLSQRTHESMPKLWADKMGYRAVMFRSAEEHEVPIYHTNVMMNICSHFCVICLQAVLDRRERDMLRCELMESGRELIEIDHQQLEHFCGNVLEVRGGSGEKYFVMSDDAYQHFTASQIKRIEQFGSIIHSDLKTIEQIGGGSARCMLAELF